MSQTAKSKEQIKVGDTFPTVVLHESTPATKVNIGELLSKSRRAIVFGVPGAFTPNCSRVHLPSYVRDYDALKSKGVDLICCVSVNDAFVMHAWGENQHATGKIRMLADPHCELTRALGLENFNTMANLGNVRCKRFASVIENGVVRLLNVEPDGGGVTCSLSGNILEALAKMDHA